MCPAPGLANVKLQGQHQSYHVNVTEALTHHFYVSLYVLSITPSVVWCWCIVDEYRFLSLSPRSCLVFSTTNPAFKILPQRTKTSWRSETSHQALWLHEADIFSGTGRSSLVFYPRADAQVRACPSRSPGSLMVLSGAVRKMHYHLSEVHNSTFNTWLMADYISLYVKITSDLILYAIHETCNISNLQHQRY